MNFDANTENLKKIKNLLGKVKEKMITISSGISSIDFSGTGLQNNSLVRKMTNAIQEIVDGKYGDESLSELENNVNKTIAMLNNSEAGDWFSEINQFSYEDYENFADFLESINDIQIIYAIQLTAPLGFVEYERPDGRMVKETWCNLKVGQLIKNMREVHGVDLEYWVREDGVRMYGPYVMVAADVPAMGGGNQEAEYRYGDLVETTLGTGIIVDYCEDAVNTRKKTNGEVIRYDIYAAWYETPYIEMNYEYTSNGQMVGKKEAIESQIVGVKYREEKVTIYDEIGTEAYTPKQINGEQTTTTLSYGTPGANTGSFERPVYTQQQPTTTNPNTYYTETNNEINNNSQATQQTTISKPQPEITPVETIKPSTEQTTKPVVDIGESVHIKEDTVTEVEENLNDDNILPDNTDDELISAPDIEESTNIETPQNPIIIEQNKGGTAGGIIAGLLASIAAFFGIKYGKKKLKNKDNNDI